MWPLIFQVVNYKTIIIVSLGKYSSKCLNQANKSREQCDSKTTFTQGWFPYHSNKMASYYQLFTFNSDALHSPVARDRRQETLHH
jgi:hypothetical protein